MNIHVADPSGAQKEYAEPELRALWSQGGIHPTAMYWKDGMQEWQPLAGYFSPYAAPSSEVSAIGASVGSSTSGFQYVKDPEVLTKFLLVSLFISLGLDVICLLSDYAQFSLLSREYTVAEGEANDARQSILSIIHFGFFIFTGVVFLKWIYRAAVNSRGFGATGLEHSPGWSVGSYFIPILCLFRPYQAMREIWQVSHDPTGWQAVPTGWVMKVWWTLWLVSGLIGQISTRVAMDAEDIDELKLSTTFSMLNYAETILLTLVAVKLVKTIAGNQERLVRGGEDATSSAASNV